MSSRNLLASILVAFAPHCRHWRSYVLFAGSSRGGRLRVAVSRILDRTAKCLRASRTTRVLLQPKNRRGGSWQAAA